MKNIFENAFFGKRYLCRNNTIAYYCRCVDNKHYLMVDDSNNDFVLCNEDGHIFDPEKLKSVIPEGKNKGKTICELYGWNYEEMVNYRLDIVAEWQEEINEKELDRLANQYVFEVDGTFKINELVQKAFKSGYRKAMEE